jgi:hypothetical protein
MKARKVMTDSLKYHKIQSIFKRDQKTGSFLPEYSTPEIEYLAEAHWVFTEKIDGTNIRVMWDGMRVTFGGRTDRAQIPAHLVEKLMELFHIDSMDEAFPRDPDEHGDLGIVLFGEGCGPKIQKNGAAYTDGKTPDFILFDVRVGHWWLRAEDVDGIADKLGIRHAPFVDSGTLDEAIDIACDPFPSLLGDRKAEGLVCRPAVELTGRNGRRIITKVKTKDYQR